MGLSIQLIGRLLQLVVSKPKRFPEKFESGMVHPGRLTWNIINGGLEDDFPFPRGDFEVPC